MSIELYLEAVAAEGTVSEIAFYTPLTTHLLHGLLGYPTSHCLINKRNESGIPDLRILASDQSEWIVCEAKLMDADIREETRRQRIWQEQIVQRHYITSETLYVLLCAPYTLRVLDTRGRIILGVDLHPEAQTFSDIQTQTEYPLKDSELLQALSLISYAASASKPQYEAFRRGELEGGYLPLTQETVRHLQPVFEFALRELKGYCKIRFDHFQAEYQASLQQRQEVAEQLELVGTEEQLVERVRNRERDIKRQYRLSIQLFEEDYLQFKHDQAYSGTEEEAHFEDIFLTNTAYIALTRLFFVRICEDIGLTTRKVSHEGPGLWAQFVRHIKQEYRDLLEVAYKDAAHIYSHLFETTVFDWYGTGNGELNALFERILIRLNAFSFEKVDRDLLGTVYQYFRPKAERKRLGEYYTPEEVVDYILARTGITSDPDLMSRRILDPACGSFTFGVRAILPLLQSGQHLTARYKLELIQRVLAGRDINAFSVFLAHLSLLFSVLDIYHAAKAEDPKFVLPGFDVVNVNALVYETGQVELGIVDTNRTETQDSSRFDYVVGNPPFVRNERLPKEDRDALGVAFAALRSGNTDLATFFLHRALESWLKEGGVLGMVAPIGQVNSRNAALLRTLLANYTILEIVSLEWMAKEVFPDADIIPILLFIKKEAPPENHRIKIVTGLANKEELLAAAEEGDFRAGHVSEIDFAQWLRLSPTGDWPLDVTARDIPLLQKLSEGPRLQEFADASYGIKLGSRAAKIAYPRREGATRPQERSFAKGQHLCAFGLSQPEEVIDLSRIQEASDPSLWRNTAFYERNQGKRNLTGINGTTFANTSLLEEELPSDTLCCLVPQITTTLTATVADPLEVAINNSAIVVVPRQCSAHVLAAVINSRPCRYYAFLTMRAAILLRRRSTWYPRILKNLPWPRLTEETALTLHTLAMEAATLSESAQRTELSVYLQGMTSIRRRTEAGFLGVYLTGPTSLLETDDLAAVSPLANTLEVGSYTLHAPDTDTLLLARLAALATETTAWNNHAIQGLKLPANREERQTIAEAVRELSGHLVRAQSRMEALTNSMDTLIAEGLGLTPAEQAVLWTRCTEFPLNVTIGRPRYVWNADRKTQARRSYTEGQRFQ